MIKKLLILWAVQILVQSCTVSMQARNCYCCPSRDGYFSSGYYVVPSYYGYGDGYGPGYYGGYYGPGYYGGHRGYYGSRYRGYYGPRYYHRRNYHRWRGW